MSNPDMLAIVLTKLDRIERRLETLVPPPATSRKLTVRQAAEAANKSQDCIRRAIYGRELRFHQARTGAAIRIDSRDLDAWMKRHAVEPVRR